MYFGALMVVIGLICAAFRIPRNPFFGVRIKWTFADEEIWHKGNRACGIMLILMGAALMISGMKYFPITMLVSLVPLLVVSIGYPMVLYKKKYGRLSVDIEAVQQSAGIVIESSRPPRLVRFIPLFLLVVMFAFPALHWKALPERMPMHFNFQGEADAWDSKEWIFLMPGMTLGTWLVIVLAFAHFNRHKSKQIGFTIYWEALGLEISLVLFLACLELGTILYGTGRIANINPWIYPPLGFMLLVLIWITVSSMRKALKVKRMRAEAASV